ncbi:HU family DNA-binding protein [Parabacteroides sp.]
MNKKDLESVIAQKMDIPQKEAHLFIQTMMEIITEALKENQEILLYNFGRFIPKQRKERPVRNPKTGTPCMLKPIQTVKFYPGKGLIKDINCK